MPTRSPIEVQLTRHYLTVRKLLKMMGKDERLTWAREEAERRRVLRGNEKAPD